MKKSIIIYFLLTIFHCSKLCSQNITINKDLNIVIEQLNVSQVLTVLDSINTQILNQRINKNLLSNKDRSFHLEILEFIGTLLGNPSDSLNQYKSELLDFFPINHNTYMAQINIKHKNKPDIQLIYNLIATVNERVYFSSLLDYNTSNWNNKIFDTVNYFYRNGINEDRANSFSQKNKLFHKFEKEAVGLKFYMVNNYQEILQLIGVDYNSSTIGKMRDGLGVVGDVIFSIMNNEDFSHDLFHFYSGKIHNDNIRNCIAEEGVAYSWGNAYYTNTNSGEMTNQSTLVSELKKYLERNNKVSLLELFENHLWRDSSGIYNQLAPDYQVGRLLASLICDKVEHKYGMIGINQLLSCGTSPNQFAPFLDITDKLIGINRNNFDREVQKLLDDY